MGIKTKTGVYVCHCGSNIAATVDVEDVTTFAARLPHVKTARHYPYMCSDPGQGLIRQDIRDKGLNRIVVAACSPRIHENTFRRTLEEAGLNPYCLEMANIREQCSWVHGDRSGATAKARKTVAAAAARARLLEPLQQKEVPVEPAVLVLGGGIAGIQCALDVAGAGFTVYLVEKEPSIGGRMAQLDKTFPTLDCSACILTPRMVDAAAHPRIELLSYSCLEEVSGYAGNFSVRVRKKARYVDADRCTGCGDCARECRLAGRVPSSFDLGLGRRSAIYRPFPQAVPAHYTIDRQRCLFLTKGRCGDAPPCVQVCSPGAIDFEQRDEVVELKVGAIVVATGCDLFDPSRKPEYGYRDYNNVITAMELERLLSASGPTEGSVVLGEGEDASVPRDIAFIKCVGSRDKSAGSEHCSKVCCMYTAKLAHLLGEKVPGASIRVYYMDVRASGKGYEEFYDRVRREGVRYIRGSPSEIFQRGSRLVVKVEDTLASTPLEDEVDMVVLAVGLEARGDAGRIVDMLRLSRSADGFFLEAHPKLAPVDTAVDGIYLAGACQAPKDIPDTVAQAKAAAASALGLLSAGRIKVGAEVCVVNEETCRGCGYCVQICPYGAVELAFSERYSHETALVNEVLCKGCGACAAACFSGSMQQRSFRDEHILSQVAVLGSKGKGDQV